MILIPRAWRDCSSSTVMRQECGALPAAPALRFLDVAKTAAS